MHYFCSIFVISRFCCCWLYIGDPPSSFHCAGPPSSLAPPRYHLYDHPRKELKKRNPVRLARKNSSPTKNRPMAHKMTSIRRLGWVEAMEIYRRIRMSKGDRGDSLVRLLLFLTRVFMVLGNRYKLLTRMFVVLGNKHKPR